jgi:hypothetical protein
MEISVRQSNSCFPAKKLVAGLLLAVLGAGFFNLSCLAQTTATSTASTTPATIVPTDSSLVYGDSDVPAILPRSTWDNSPDLHNLLTWIPQSATYPSDWQPVERIVIHHSATDNNDQLSAIARIQSIYRFQAVTKGWGDIGYDYIIDRQGKIYEGRYGGNGVRGAHLFRDSDKDNFNYGSVGIVLLGNFTNQDASSQMYASLERLVGWLAATNNLDPLSVKTSLIWNFITKGFTDSFTGYAVLGHKNIENTDCPGIVNLNAVRQQAAAYAAKYRNYIYQVSDNIYQTAPDSSGPDNNFYQITSGARKVYVNLAAFSSAGGTYNKIVKISKSQLDLFSSDRFYKYLAGSLLKSDKSSTIYLVDSGGKIRPFNVTSQQFTNFGYDMSSVKTIPKDELDFYVVGQPILYGPDNSLVKKQSEPNVYFVEKGKTRSIKSAALFELLGFVWSKIRTLADAEIDNYLAGDPMIYPDGSLVKSGQSSTVYLIQNQQLRPILSAEIFESLKYSWSKIRILPQTEIASLAMGDSARHPDGALLKSQDSPTVYVIKSGQKIPIASAAAFVGAGYKWSDVIALNSNDLNLLYPGTVAGASTSGGDQSNTASSNRAAQNIVRVAIYAAPQFQNVVISSNGQYQYCNVGNSCQTKTGQTVVPYSTSAYAKFISLNGSILEVVSYTDWNWNKSANYNKFRGNIEVKFSPKSQKLWIINELPLEDYLKGIGEVNSGEDYGYIKTLITAARTYAYYYLKQGGKYGGDEIFHLDNTPSCQLYKGYGRESLASDIVRAVNETAGEIITYNGQPIVAAYSSGAPEIYTSGTRGACLVWGGKYCQPGYEYLSGGVKDPAGAPYTRATCGADNHCAGMSAAGARQLIRNGKTYQEVLTYYYKNTLIQKIY